MSDGGSQCTGTKNDLLTCLEKVSDVKTETHVTTCTVTDGAAVVQMLKPAASKTFLRVCTTDLHLIMCTKLQTVRCLDLIWDTYLADTCKEGTRHAEPRGGCRSHYTRKLAELPTSGVDSNKTELFRFFSAAVMVGETVSAATGHAHSLQRRILLIRSRKDNHVKTGKENNTAFLFKSTHHSWGYERNCKSVFFLNTVYRLEMFKNNFIVS